MKCVSIGIGEQLVHNIPPFNILYTFPKSMSAIFKYFSRASRKLSGKVLSNSLNAVAPMLIQEAMESSVIRKEGYFGAWAGGIRCLHQAWFTNPEAK
jgi:hypothetical protein